MTKTLERVIDVKNLIGRANTTTRIAAVWNFVSRAYTLFWINGIKDKVSWAKTFIRMVGIRHLISWTTWASFASLHTLLPYLFLVAFFLLLQFFAFLRFFLVLTCAEQHIVFWKNINSSYVKSGIRYGPLKIMLKFADRVGKIGSAKPFLYKRSRILSKL